MTFTRARRMAMPCPGEHPGMSETDQTQEQAPLGSGQNPDVGGITDSPGGESNPTPAGGGQDGGTPSTGVAAPSGDCTTRPCSSIRCVVASQQTRHSPLNTECAPQLGHA